MKKTKLGPKTYEEALLKKRIKQTKEWGLPSLGKLLKISHQTSQNAPKRIKKQKVKKVSKKGYYKELLAQNKWVNKIPHGSHGTTPLQKKLWRLVTDYVRIRDFLRWGTCISCSTKFSSWQEAQGGHYRAFSKCKGWKKYCYRNVFAQCPFCNSRMNEDKFEGGRIFAQNIVTRYGQEILDEINTYTHGEPEKVEVDVVIVMMYEIVKMMHWLDIKPDYYKIIMLDEELLKHVY